MKKISKLMIFALVLLISMSLFVACGDSTDTSDNDTKKEDANNKDTEKEDTNINNEPKNEEVKLNVATLKGPTGMGMSKLMEDVKKGDSNLDLNFSVYGAPDQLIGKITSGEVDIAAVPSNMASILYNKTKGNVKLAGINTLGVLYILDTTGEIETMEDLKGKTIYASGKGATPDYIIRYLLKENGIDPEKDVTLDFKSQHAELAAQVASGDAPIALLPQPHVTTATMKNKDVKIAINLTEEWEKVKGKNSKLAMGAIIVNKDVAKKNKDAVNKFLDEYEKSINWVNDNHEDAGKLIEKHGILPKAKLAKMAIPKSNIVFIDSEKSQEVLKDFYKVLFEFNPKSLGGKIPNEDFYYER
ncbi:ABC transporter substrate-binding protein [Dethiothermospora halolimnae]|uniref:ABC transporter substrate-binding protein n=1 Tax=Dethiothermospora halolimnae TaxID=3114390 RepID=UPI003CCB7AD7